MLFRALLCLLPVALSLCWLLLVPLGLISKDILIILAKDTFPGLAVTFITSLYFHQHRNLCEVDIFLRIFLVHL